MRRLTLLLVLTSKESHAICRQLQVCLRRAVLGGVSVGLDVAALDQHLLAFAQEHMDEMGVDMTIVSCFMQSRVDVLYMRMGYKELERTFVRFKDGF